MCDLLVAPEAPAPPVTEAGDDDPASTKAWATYFVSQNAFLDEVKPLMEGLADSDSSDLAQDAFGAFLEMRVEVGFGNLSAVLVAPDAPSASDMDEAWTATRIVMDKMCPQWVGQDWPYEGQPAQAAAEPSPSASPSVEYKKVSSRQWAKIAKNPDGHIGEAIIVYGVITQFDSATGTDTFRADVEATRSSDWYDYDTNTFLTGNQNRLEDFVEDDIFMARVIVDGSYSYETTMGGEITVPVLDIRGIKRIGSAE